MVLAFRHQPVENFDHRRRNIRLAARALTDRHKRVRLFGTHGEETPRPVIFETPPQDPHTVRHQGGG